MRDHLLADPLTGAIELVIEPEPSFRAELVVPAPFASPQERARRVQLAKDSVWLRGLYVASEEPFRNDVFDGPDEQTSTRLIARPCMDAEEAREVEAELNRITYEASE